jgi:hypothetical protein
MQESTTAPDIYAQLPETLRGLIDRSMSLHARIQRIDRELKGEVEVTAVPNPVTAQLGQLAAAFARK